MIDADAVVQLYHQRRQARAPIFQRMELMKRQVNGDVMVPLPELDEMEKAAVPNLIAQGLDGLSQRIASVLPMNSSPVLRPGIQSSENKSRQREKALDGWWDMNYMSTKLRRRARYLLAYGTSPVSIDVVSPDPSDQRRMPFWRVRNPLNTFAAPTPDPDCVTPDNVIFCDQRPMAWLRETYPEAARVIYKANKTDDVLVEVLEYLDGEETVLVALGSKRDRNEYVDESQGTMSTVLLDRVPNRAGICPVVVPGRITLDRLCGHFDSILGMYYRQAKLDALTTIAVFRSVFPDQWAVSHPTTGRQPKVIREADGKLGVVGIIEGGTLINTATNPSQASEMAIDRLERAQRLTAGLPAELGGESATNIRTARRGEMVMGNSVDPTIQEDQEVFAISLAQENRRAIAYMKAYYGEQPSMFILPGDGKVTRPDYVPNTAFETDMCWVKYSMPGSDVNGLVIAIGQRIGMGTLSTMTGMEMDPAVEDPIKERDRIQMEGLDKAILAGLETQASQGQLDPKEVAAIAAEKAAENTPLWRAVLDYQAKAAQAQAAAQAAQAQQQPMGAAQVPGPGGPQAAGTAGLPGIAAPPQGGANLADLLKNLRRPAAQGPSEQALAPTGS